MHNPHTAEYLNSKIPDEKFQIIYMDPPWYYNKKLQYDKTDLYVSSASFKYPAMKTKEMMKIPIDKISDDNCLLFMWSTSPHLDQAIMLGESWKFKYKTVSFVWNKMIHNPGQYTLSNCELCLVFKKGKIPQPRGARNIQQLVNVRRTKHSEKPEVVRKGIECMFPAQKKIEIFAVKKYINWSSWGLDLI